MKSDTDIFYSQSQVSREFESGIDIKYLISLIEIASDTYNRQKINASKFSLFLSTLNNDSENSTILPQKSESSTILEISTLDKSKFISKYKDFFVRILKSSNINNAEESEAEHYFNYLLEKDKDGATKLLEEIFISTLTGESLDEDLQVSILKLLCNYDFKELSPSAQLIATSAYSINSIRVKSVTFDLFGHWANIEAYNMLKKYNEPQEPWLKMKYKALLKSLKIKYDIY